MVSLNLNSPEGFYLDSFTPAPENFPANEMVELAASTNDESNSKKIRKPYTISKSRESWSEPEHDKFLEALQLFDRDWKKIEAFIGSKTVIQIRSHAQKYFLKVQKSGTNEHLPPPRPKRKASHPYPQKAPKNATPAPQATGALQASPLLLEPGIQRQDPTLTPLYPTSTATFSSWAANSQTPGVLNGSQGDTKFSGPIIANNCSSSNESTAIACPPGHFKELMKHGPPLKVLPDFAQVYGFIGSVFDPEASDHLQSLRNMDPIDVETVLLLMRNLSINLTSPDFEDHRKLLSSCDIDSNEAISSGE